MVERSPCWFQVMFVLLLPSVGFDSCSSFPELVTLVDSVAELVQSFWCDALELWLYCLFVVVSAMEVVRRSVGGVLCPNIFPAGVP